MLGYYCCDRTCYYIVSIAWHVTVIYAPAEDDLALVAINGM